MKNKKSLENSIRELQKKYKNVPSPLQFMNENSEIQKVKYQQSLNQKKDLRSSLTDGFISPKNLNY
jgi:hypothetical protein